MQGALHARYSAFSRLSLIKQSQNQQYYSRWKVSANTTNTVEYLLKKNTIQKPNTETMEIIHSFTRW